MLEFVISVR